MIIILLFSFVVKILTMVNFIKMKESGKGCGWIKGGVFRREISLQSGVNSTMGASNGYFYEKNGAFCKERRPLLQPTIGVL